MAGVVPRQSGWVFSRQVEGLRHAPDDDIEGLLLIRFKTGEHA
jgi:hypothetical protein